MDPLKPERMHIWLPHLHIGDNAVIGMGSVVVKDVDANVTVAGVPAKKLEK